MGVIVTYDYNAFIALFPQFNYLTSPQVQTYWNLATSFNRNDGGGPVTSTQMQTDLLNLATAHILQLLAPLNGGAAPPGLVGRINSATQGSVSVGTDMQVPAGSASWWNQTQFGASYWLLSAPFRTMKYIPGPQRPVEPWPVAGTGFINPGWGNPGWSGPLCWW